MSEWGPIEWMRAYILITTTVNLLLVLRILSIIRSTFKIITDSANAITTRT